MSTVPRNIGQHWKWSYRCSISHRCWSRAHADSCHRWRSCTRSEGIWVCFELFIEFPHNWNLALSENFNWTLIFQLLFHFLTIPTSTYSFHLINMVANFQFTADRLCSSNELVDLEVFWNIFLDCFLQVCCFYYAARAKLRHIMYQCFHQATHVLRAEPGLVGRLVPLVIDSLVRTVAYVIAGSVSDYEFSSCVCVFF